MLFAGPATTLEEVELLLRRWLGARRHGRGGFIFVLADVHELSYTLQCRVVDKLRALTSEYGTRDAASP